MFVRSTITAMAALALLATAPATPAEKLDKDAKKWLDEVKALILPEEEKTFRELKDRGEREEFQKIFWARRDPDMGTPENEYQASYLSARAEADAQYKTSRPGSQTDCGRVFLLLGKPDSVQQDPAGETPVLRRPETWIYKDSADQKFAGGEAKIRFQANCELPQGDRLAEAMVKVAENKIKNPNIGYKKTSDGKLVKLVDQLPKPSATQTLLKTPRQDFPLAVERKLMTRLPGGGTYVAFTVQAPAGAVNPAKVVITGRATEKGGAVIPVTDREIMAPAQADGTFVGSLGLTLNTGSYDVQVALLDPASGKGSVASVPVEITDPTGTDIAISTIVLQDVQQGVEPKLTDPFSAFAFGTTTFLPRAGNVFKQGESFTLVSFLYGGVKDAEGKTSVTVSIALNRDGKAIGKMDPEQFTTPASPSIGPVPLTQPGTYTADIKVTDNVTKKDYTDKATFTVK